MTQFLLLTGAALALLLVLSGVGWALSTIAAGGHSGQSDGSDQGPMSVRLRRAIAVLQVVGAAVLLLSLAGELIKLPQTHNFFSLGLYALFAIFAIWAIIFGIELWKGHESSLLPSAVIWLLQTPHLVSSPLSYSVVLGLATQFQLAFTPNGTAFAVNFPLLEQHILYFAGQQQSFVIGINALAASITYALFRARLKPQR
jgi:hypothetical protein